ncbi:MAG TPA: TonB-dependent receptor, partial [Phnomibacter sp.]|nr:TonB-dependent receptor [Phnomibacter sp.]
NRLYGDINVSYKILPELKASVITRANFLNYFSDARTATGGLELDAYSITNGQFSEFNYEGRLEYNKRFGNFGVRQLLGGNLMNQNRRQNNGATVGGLSVPNLYSLTASRDRPSVGNSWLDYRINSAFANGGLDYKNMIFVDWSVRNDWVSSLPENLRSYLYPSVATSFVFSDLLGRSFKNVLSFGKLRAAYGQSGQAPAAYTLNLAYGLGQPYGANPTMSVPTTVYDPAIKPALTNEIEVGTELQFFKNRLGVDFTWYQKNGKDQIIPLGVTPSSGSGTVWINAGLLRSQGWDLVLNGSPIKSRNWNLDIQLNLSRNISTTLDLDTAKNLRNRSLGAAAFGPSVNARVGERYGTFVGTRNLIDDKTGLPVINAAGNWVRQQNQILGNALPEFMGGGVANLSYKNWSLSTTFSFQKGGMFFSTTRLFTLYSGLVEETVGLNDKGNPKRDAPSAGGGVRVDGVLANGTPTTVYVDAQTYYGNMFGVHNFFLQEASYVKLAEARISYTLPAGKLIKGMKPATISFISRNPWLIWAPAKDWGVDPSEIENFNQFFEGGQLPPVRSFGLNISFGF